MGYENTQWEEHCADIETRQHEIWRLYVDCIKVSTHYLSVYM